MGNQNITISESSRNSHLKKIGESKKDEENTSDLIILSNDLLVQDKNTNFNEDYKILETLGEGAFGKVYKVKNIYNNEIRAMKILNKTSGKRNRELEKDVINEINILKSMDHPNIMKIFEFYNCKDCYSIILELCTGGDFFQEIDKKSPFREDYVSYIMYQIFSAVNYCHKMKIIHRDLKPENILIVNRDRNGWPHIKICDFGTAKLFINGMIQRQTIGSSYYIAPEVLKASYNEKCDLWSCGVIMYLLLSGRVPFNGKDDEEIFKNVRKGKYDLSEDPFDKISDECRSLLTGLLNMNNTKRLNSYEALNHPFISKYKSKEKFNSINNKREIGNLFDNLKKFKSNSILQDTTLAYLVHNFPQNSDVVNACKLFNLIDKNGDGKISQKELSDYVKENLPEIKENDIKNLFLILDKDNSGFIQYEEFVRGAVTKNKFMEERLLKFAFKFFDKDDSGEITIDEIEELFYKNIKDKKNVKDILKKIIEEADINKDGKISFREFTKIMKKIVC